MKILSPLLVAVLLLGCVSTTQPTAGQAVSKVVAAAVQTNFDVSPAVECAIRVGFLTPIAIAIQHSMKKLQEAEAKIQAIGQRAVAERREPTLAEHVEIQNIRAGAVKFSLISGLGLLGFGASYMFIDSQFDPISWGYWWSRGWRACFPAAVVTSCADAFVGRMVGEEKLGPWSKYIRETLGTTGMTALAHHLDRRYVEPRFRPVKPMTGQAKAFKVAQDVLPFAIAKALF